MADLRALRRSALPPAADRTGRPVPGNDRATIAEIPDLVLHQIAVWPQTLHDVRRRLCARFGDDAATVGRSALEKDGAALLRIDPLRFWHLGGAPMVLDPSQAAVLDLSHSRTRIRIAGEDARLVLNRHVPLDLRDARFPDGAVASTVMHGVGVTLWRRGGEFDVFLPRSFARALVDRFR